MANKNTYNPALIKLKERCCDNNTKNGNALLEVEINNDQGGNNNGEGGNNNGEGGNNNGEGGNNGSGETGTSKPGTSKPGTSKPGTSEPGTSEPGTSKPGTSETGTSKTGTSKTGTSKPGTSKPGTSKPGTSKPGTSKPGTSEPGTSEPGTSKPGTSKPGTSEPGSGSSDGKLPWYKRLFNFKSKPGPELQPKPDSRTYRQQVGIPSDQTYYQSRSSPKIVGQVPNQYSSSSSRRNKTIYRNEQPSNNLQISSSSSVSSPSASKNKSNDITSMNTVNKKSVNLNSNLNGNNTVLGKTKKTVKNLKKSLLGDTGKQVLIILVVALVTFLLMWFVRRWLLNTRNNTKYAPYLIEGSKSGKSSVVISGDPNEEGSIPLYRSDGEDGAEFTYSFWMVIESMEYNFGKWKHVFHRGNKTSFPNRAPGVWLHPEQNTIRVYMNTYENPLEYVDIDNIPVRKWFHCSIVLNSKYLDIYFNGKLKHRKELESAPRQNYGAFWSGLFGGFEGYLSKVRYFNKALEYNEIENIVKQGPSKDACGDTGDYPPYLDDDWWFDMKF